MLYVIWKSADPKDPDGDKKETPLLYLTEVSPGHFKFLPEEYHAMRFPCQVAERLARLIEQSFGVDLGTPVYIHRV